MSINLYVDTQCEAVNFMEINTIRVDILLRMAKKSIEIPGKKCQDEFTLVGLSTTSPDPTGRG